MTSDDLTALKTAFTYMPKSIEVNKYEYGERFQTVLDHITLVREALIEHGVDPDEVDGEINSDTAPNSCY